MCTTTITITLSESVLTKARAVAALTDRTVSSVVEDALREMLSESAEQETSDDDVFRLPSYHSGGFLVDVLDKEALADALGDNDPR